MNEVKFTARGYRDFKRNNAFIVYIPIDLRGLIHFIDAVVIMTDDGFKIREASLLDNKYYKITKTKKAFLVCVTSNHLDLSGNFEVEVIGDWIYFIKD